MKNICTVHNTYTPNFLLFVCLLSSVALPIDLFCFGDFELVFVGVSRFIGVLGGLCNLLFAFLTLLGSLLAQRPQLQNQSSSCACGTL